MKRVGVGLLVAAILTVIGACGDPLSTPTESSAAPRMMSRVVLDSGVTYEQGVLGPGAIYEIYTPPGWQIGALVLYVHGYVSPYDEPGLPEDLDDSVLEMLLGGGFAVAYSSFSETGWAVRDGAIRSRQLLGYFRDNYGDPEEVYLVGASQGGLIALSLAEQNPNLFDGLLSISGAIGGGPLQMEYLTHVRALFDRFFGEKLHLLAGTVDPIAAPSQALLAALGDGVLDADPEAVSPELSGYLEYFPEVVAALVLGHPETALALAATLVDGVPLFNWRLEEILDPAVHVFLFEVVETIASALWFNIFGTPDLLERTNGHAMVDNSGTQYWSLVLNAEENLRLNDEVERITAHPAGTNYLSRWYQPTGWLRFPMMTVHVSRDPAVPILHERTFAAIVAGAGSSDYLVQREFDGFGHGDLREAYGDLFIQYVLSAFADLVLWVTSGVAP